MNKVLHSSKRMNWCTPAWLADEISNFMGGIDLDPCANRKSPVKAAYKYYRKGETQPWRGTVFVNPPYGREIPAWIEKCHLEYETYRASDIVALVPARTDTKWFQRSGFTSACLMKGRLKFVGAKWAAPFPSALLYWGSHNQIFMNRFQSLGMII